DLRAHGSALMPFFDDGVKVEPITYFEKPGNGGRAAVHLKNDTPQTFPAGPMAIFADDGFAGETALSRTKPGEERILRFGFDLDLELEEVQHLQVDEPRVLRVQGEQLVRHFVRHHAHTYNLSNKSGRSRKVYLALAYVRNAEVKGVDALTYDEEKKQPLAVFTSAARSKQRHELKVREGLSEGQKLADLKAATLRSLAAQASLPKEQRAILQRTSRHLEASERHARGAAAARSQSNDVEYDMARLRKNLAAARGESALLDRLLAAETKLSALRRRIADLDQRAKSERKRGLALLRRLNEIKP
ncbi:MAG TPA: hypothetical protein VFB62_18475, partial [Polyangiaceae bacterium]|nr:hypothetical protein [Polyangiaceae bacterium]